VGLVLFRTDRVMYAGFCWWLWILAPEIRRLADYQAGWNALNPISVTPLLVSALTLASVVRHLPTLRRRWLFPFVIALAGIGYGYIVGLARSGPLSATYAAASWLVPVAFGVQLALGWEEYPRYRSAIATTLTLGALLLGAYGIAQFLRPPPWDAYWMRNADMYSIGVPEPYRVRVFSMLNSPAPFAAVMSAALFVAISTRSPWRLPAAAGAVAGLLLSLVRSAWLGCVAGIVAYAMHLRTRARRRLLLAFAAGAVVLGSAATTYTALSSSPLVIAVTSRLATFGTLSADRSFKVRRGYLRAYVREIAEQPLGHGLGATGVGVSLNRGRGVQNFDNGLLEVIYTLGWAGGAAYLLATLALLARLSRSGSDGDDVFATALRAVVVATLVQALSSNVFSNVSGVVLWGSLGLLAAAHRWRGFADAETAGATLGTVVTHPDR
jgi:hypothetical protein